jgi:hypothetical protein
MQKYFPLILGLLFSISLFAQHEPIQPFEELGIKVSVLTLSKGKYQESFPNDTIMRIGSVMFNHVTGEVVTIMMVDTLYAEYNLKADVVSRWLSIDPLAAKHPDLSPYNFVRNNPIIYIDPDGQDYILAVNHNNQTIIVRATYYIQRGNAEALASANQATQFWNAQSGNYTYDVGKKTNISSYTVSFELNVIEVDNPVAEASNDRASFKTDVEKTTPDQSSNAYTVNPDNDRLFERNEEGEQTNGVTRGGNDIHVKNTQRNATTGTHEVGHSLGLKHFGKGIMTSTSNDLRRNNSISRKYITQIIRNTFTDKVAKGNIQEEGNAPEGFNKGNGRKIE